MDREDLVVMAQQVFALALAFVPALATLWFKSHQRWKRRVGYVVFAVGFAAYGAMTVALVEQDRERRTRARIEQTEREWVAGRAAILRRQISEQMQWARDTKYRLMDDAVNQRLTRASFDGYNRSVDVWRDTIHDFFKTRLPCTPQAARPLYDYGGGGDALTWLRGTLDGTVAQLEAIDANLENLIRLSCVPRPKQ